MFGDRSLCRSLIDHLDGTKVKKKVGMEILHQAKRKICLLYTSPSPRDRTRSRMPSSA